MSAERVHRLDPDPDRCVCGDLWVWWEPFRDLPGVYGCAAQGHEDALAHNAGRDAHDLLECPLCGGYPCDEGCYVRCRHAYEGPDSHRVCRNCGGRGRIR